MIDNKVANGVATKKKYASPEIEVIELDAQPMLLAASGVSRSITPGFAADDDSESW